MCSVILGCEFLCRSRCCCKRGVEKEKTISCACTDPTAAAAVWWRRSLVGVQWTRREWRQPPPSLLPLHRRLRTTTATMIYRLPTVPTPNWLPPLATLLVELQGKNKIRGVDPRIPYIHPLSIYAFTTLSSTMSLFFPKLFWQMLENAAACLWRRTTTGVCWWCQHVLVIDGHPLPMRAILSIQNQTTLFPPLCTLADRILFGTYCVVKNSRFPVSQWKMMKTVFLALSKNGPSEVRIEFSAVQSHPLKSCRILQLDKFDRLRINSEFWLGRQTSSFLD